MDAAIALLNNPEVIDFILSTYGSIAEWYAQGGASSTPQTHSIVIDDVLL
ncbi:MAG: hypothetical protein AAFZ52_02300 [Bacteroidota bacterium]